MMFNQYPYMNINDLNLDYILNQMKTLVNEVTNFVSLNAIKYADPIQWNITRQYEKNTIVIDPLTGTAYISVAPVPSGVALTREEYWTVVFDLSQFIVKAAQNFTNRYEQSTTLTATFPSSAGDWLVWNDTLYKALVNITAGDQYVINSNIEHITMEQIVGHLDSLNTSDKSCLVNSINEVLQTAHVLVGDLDDLTTADKSNLVAAINEVIQTFSDIIGDLNDLNTSDKTSVVNAINEVDTNNKSLLERINNAKIYNVVEYGAIGDGVADDTNAFIGTFAAAGNGIVYVPEGNYLITSTIDVTCELRLSNGATLIANNNIDVLRLRPNGTICGGHIDVSIAGFTHAAILLLGEDKFSPINDISKNSIENVHITGDHKGIGIYFHSNLLASGKSYIQNVRTFNCVIERMEIAIYCHSDTAPDNDHATWCNGNIFDMIWIEGATVGMKTEGANIPYEAAGNTFTNIQFQTFYYFTHHAVYCNSSLNTFDVFVWDYSVDGGIDNYPAFFIYGDSNRIRSNLTTYKHGHYLDRGSNTYIDSYDNYHYYEMSAGAAKKQIVGDQDDFLFAADKRYTISTTPTITNINNVFKREAGFVATLSANTPYEIILDLTTNKMVLPRAIGLVFETSTAKDITIEIYYSGSYHTIYNSNDVTSPLVLQYISGITNVEYIRISITSTVNQRLSRIFGVDSYKKGMSFLEDYGATYHGRLAFTDNVNDGIVLKDSGNGFYYLVGVNNGTLTATQI